MKNILIISSSPRKNGNSDALCDVFATTAKEKGHQVEKVFLKDYDIHYCTGCGYCQTHHGHCSQKDDALKIVSKMVEADVIVLDTPVYFYSMSAQLKTLIDRTCPLYTDITNKDFYIITTAADSDITEVRRVEDTIGGFIACLDDVRVKEVIHALGVYDYNEVNNSQYIEQIKSIVNNI